MHCIANSLIEYRKIVKFWFFETMNIKVYCQEIHFIKLYILNARIPISQTLTLSVRDLCRAGVQKQINFAEPGIVLPFICLCIRKTGNKSVPSKKPHQKIVSRSGYILFSKWQNITQTWPSIINCIFCLALSVLMNFIIYTEKFGPMQYSKLFLYKF